MTCCIGAHKMNRRKFPNGEMNEWMKLKRKWNWNSRTWPFHICNSAVWLHSLGHMKWVQERERDSRMANCTHNCNKEIYCTKPWAMQILLKCFEYVVWIWSHEVLIWVYDIKVYALCIDYAFDLYIKENSTRTAFFHSSWLFHMDRIAYCLLVHWSSLQLCGGFLSLLL